MQMAQQAHERMINIAVIREVQVKTTMRYHLTLSEWLPSKRTQITNVAKETWTLVHCWRECELVQPWWETTRRFLKILEVKLPYVPAIPLLVHIEKQASKLKTRMHANVHSSIIYNSQDMEATCAHKQMSRWKDVIYTHTHSHTVENGAVLSCSAISNFVTHGQ